MQKRARKNKPRNPTQTAFTRFMLVVAVFIAWIGGIGVRLVHLQVNEHSTLRDKALGQRRDTVKEKQFRGTIFDRSDRALAISLKVKSLYADPQEVTDVDATAADIAKVTKTRAQDIAAKLREAKSAGRRYVVLAPKLDEELVGRINEAFEQKDPKKGDAPRYPGLHWTETEKRSYPYESLAAQVIGFANADDIGSAGIEQSQEQNLRGSVFKGWQDRDRLGRVYDQSEEERREPPKDVVLTISHSIQYKVEQALEKGVRNAYAKAGMAVALDPKTGEILAMANYPTFDPNKYNEFAAESFTNRAVHDIYSPGSVFKLVTYGSAINEGSINPNGQVDCTQGFIEVAGHRFNDPHATKVMGYDEAFAVSSNVAAIKTAIAAGRENFYGYAQKFGFGQSTGIELPAEANGIFRSPKSWNGDSLASMSIGYEISVSALQIASAYATIANDGIRVQPHIIKEIRQDGKVLSTTDAPKTQVVTADTARYLRRMMREVVRRGTGRRAQLAGYTVGGKTGTAWKYDEKLKKVNADRYVSSFVGMAPLDNPSVVILVVLDEPQVAARDGGQVAAPVFRDIAEQILPELGVTPDMSVRPEDFNASEVPSEVETKVKPTDADTKAAKSLPSATSNATAAPKPKADKPSDKPADKKADEKKDQEKPAVKKPAAATKSGERKTARLQPGEFERQRRGTLQFYILRDASALGVLPIEAREKT